MLRKMIWRRTERCEGLVRYYSGTAKMYYFLSLVFKAIIILGSIWIAGRCLERLDGLLYS